MRIDGKTYRAISLAYFFAHCVHLVLMIIASFLPYAFGKHTYLLFERNWQFLIIGFVFLAAGCFFAWQSVKHRPYYCILAFVMTLIWDAIQFFFAGQVSIAQIFSEWSNPGSDISFGIGADIMIYGMLLILVDLAYLIYLCAMLFFAPKSKLQK